MNAKRFDGRLWIGVLSVLILGLIVGGCGLQNRSNAGIAGASQSEDTFSRIKSDGVMRVGFIVFSPFVIQDPETKALSGVFVDAIQEIAKQMEVKVEFEEATWNTFIAGLQSKRFDVSIAPTFSTIGRAKSVAFTSPLLAAGNSAIVRKDETRFKTIGDIDQKGIVVAVTQGEQGHEYAMANFKNAEVKVFSSSDQNLTFSEVLAGRADAALGDFWAVAQFAAAQQDSRDLFASAPYNITPVAWAVRYEDQSLLMFLNTALGCLDTAGKLDEINQRYNANFLRSRTAWKK